MAIDTLGANALASDSVTSAKIADDAVTAAKIPAGAVVADIADGGITTAKLADDAVTSAKLDTNITIGGTLGVTGLITASGSIAVGGTGSANTLDDFEEGTFDVKLRNYNTNTDTTGAVTCRYVKVGAMVMIMFPDGGTSQNGTFFSDNTNSGGQGAINHRFDVTTSTGFNALPFLPKGTGQSGVAWTRGLRSADDDSTGTNSFAVGWKGGASQIHIGRITTDGSEYNLYDGVQSNDDNVYLEKDSTVSNVVFSCSFVYYTDA